MNDKKINIWVLIGIIVVGIGLFTYKIGSQIQLGGHEALVAESARETLQGNWLVPHCNGQVRLRKTPLPYWFVAISAMIRGTNVDEFDARIYSAISACLLIVFLMIFTTKIFDRQIGTLVGLAGLSSVGIIWQAHRATADMCLTLFTTISLCMFFLAFESIREGKRSRIWFYIAYITFGIGMMVKGPVPIPVVGLPIIIYVIYTGLWKEWKKFCLLEGIIIAGVLSFWWFIVVLLVLPDAFWRWELEFFERFTGGMKDFRGPHYYIPYIFMFTLPWSIFLPAGLWTAFKKEYEKDHPEWKNAIIYLLIWLIADFLFFTISSGKRPHYIQPVLPPAIILSILGFVYYVRLATAKQVKLLSVVTVVGLIAGLIGGWFYLDSKYPYVSKSIYLQLSAIITVGIVVFYYLYRKGKLFPSAWVLSATIVISFFYVLSIVPSIMIKTNNPKRAANELKTKLPKNAKLYFVGKFSSPIVFYYHKPIKQLPDSSQVLKWLEPKNRERLFKEFYKIVTEEIEEELKKEKTIYLIIKNKYLESKTLTNYLQRKGFVPVLVLEHYRGKRKKRYIFTNDPKMKDKKIKIELPGKKKKITA